MRSFYCFHSFLCARGVVRAQKLLGYVLISPEGSNDRFAYVIVVDIPSSFTEDSAGEREFFLYKIPQLFA